MELTIHQFSVMVQHGSVIIFILNLLLHVCFASFIAKDINNLSKLGAAPQLFPPWVWVLATLIGSFFIAAIYWLMHHSTLSRNISSNFSRK